MKNLKIKLVAMAVAATLSTGALAQTATDTVLGSGATITGSVFGQSSTALGNSVNVTGSNVTAVGSVSGVSGNGSVAVGTYVGITPGTGVNNIAIGYQSTINAHNGGNITNSIAIGQNASVQNSTAGSTITNSVVIGSGATSAGSNTVSFGNGIVNSIISHIANGVSNTDAATVGQLNDALAGVSGGAISAQSTANTALSTANAAMAQVNVIAAGVSTGMAMSSAGNAAAAAAGMSEKGLGMGVGYGNFAGFNSVSIGAAKTFERVTLNLTVGTSDGGNAGVNVQAGAGWAF